MPAPPPRPSLRARLAALQRKTVFNPYWLEGRHLRRGIATLAPHAQGLLVDVGVGERPYGALFTPRVRRYIGLEYPPACDNLNPGITSQLVEQLRGAVDIWGDGHHLPLRADCADTVLSLEVLEHVPDPDRCVAEIARILKPGGRLLLSVPFLAPQHALPYDFYRYTPQGLAALLGRHGLSIESLAPRGNAASTAGSFVAQWLLRAFGSRGLTRDGAVLMSRWRAPLVLPFIGLAQSLFLLFEPLCSDTNACLGYVVVARKAA